MFKWIKKIYIKRKNGEFLVKEVERSLENILSEFSYPDSDIFIGVRKYLQNMYDNKSTPEEIANMKMNLIQKLNDVHDIVKISFTPDYEKYKIKADKVIEDVKLKVIDIFNTTNEHTQILAVPYEATLLTSLERFRSLLAKRHG